MWSTMFCKRNDYNEHMKCRQILSEGAAGIPHVQFLLWNRLKQSAIHSGVIDKSNIYSILTIVENRSDSTEMYSFTSSQYLTTKAT